MGGSKKVRVAHELPTDRRKIIKKALEEHESEARHDWDRENEWKPVRFFRKIVKPGQSRTVQLPLLDVSLGDKWPIPITIIHGTRPGPVVTIVGALHGDELTGTSACTNLLSPKFLDTSGPLDPQGVAGTIRIAPLINLPGYREKSRYFPDGRDINRNFTGRPSGSTTSRVAHQVWKHLIKDTDVIIDLHAAAKGRSNMPQIRADLSHPESNLLAKAFGIELILDSRPPKGSLRGEANKVGIAAVTYEGGGADFLDHQAVNVAVHGCLNVLKKLKVIPGNPIRPPFRLNAGGSKWLRAGEGGLLDLFVEPGSVVQKGDVVAVISDPASPGLIVDIVAPEDGLMICTATNPFVTAGMPVAHFLAVSKHIELLKTKLDEHNKLIIQGSNSEPIWRDIEEVDELNLEGEWSGGNVDAEWQSINEEINEHSGEASSIK